MKLFNSLVVLGNKLDVLGHSGYTQSVDDIILKLSEPLPEGFEWGTPRSVGLEAKEEKGCAEGSTAPNATQVAGAIKIILGLDDAVSLGTATTETSGNLGGGHTSHRRDTQYGTIPDTGSEHSSSAVGGEISIDTQTNHMLIGMKNAQAGDGSAIDNYISYLEGKYPEKNDQNYDNLVATMKQSLDAAVTAMASTIVSDAESLDKDPELGAICVADPNDSAQVISRVLGLVQTTYASSTSGIAGQQTYENVDPETGESGRRKREISTDRSRQSQPGPIEMGETPGF